MDELHQWMNDQLEQKRVEPNSGLGQALGYMRNHWGPLTLFLRQAGAPCQGGAGTSDPVVPLELQASPPN
jgi:hypothetical protein